MSDKLTGVSLFTGAGGMDVGFEQAGIEVIFANELVKTFADTYCANHDPSVMHVGDVAGIIDTIGNLKGADLVFGGAPCQGFSQAGKMDPADPRSQLIWRFLDVVERVEPRAFVMENVKALGQMRRWEDVRMKYMRRASNMGYACHRFILNATDYGVPQKRERVFFVGVRGAGDFEDLMWEILETHKEKAPTVREALSDLGKAGTAENPATCPAKITFAKNPIMRSTPYAGMYFNGAGRPVDVDHYANTVPASMGGNRTPIIDEDYLYGSMGFDWVAGYHRDLRGGMSPRSGEAPKWLRRITIREVMRLQTFPDDYELRGSVTSQYRQLGNAVPVKLAKAVGVSVVELLDKMDANDASVDASATESKNPLP